MSQGELHALTLALFVPRATVEGSPFRFIVLDDPVQAMDPSKVDGFAHVLDELAKTRQVVVFTHDDRLPQAVRDLGIDARIVEVSRATNSAVKVGDGKDLAWRYLDDAFAVAKDDRVPKEIRNKTAGTLGRMAVEAAAREVYMGRRFRSGDSRVVGLRRFAFAEDDDGPQFRPVGGLPPEIFRLCPSRRHSISRSNREHGAFQCDQSPAVRRIGHADRLFPGSVIS